MVRSQSSAGAENDDHDLPVEGDMLGVPYEIPIHDRSWENLQEKLDK